MEQILIRNLPQGTKWALRTRAERHGRSVEAEARAILAEALDRRCNAHHQARAGRRQEQGACLSHGREHVGQQDGEHGARGPDREDADRAGEDAHGRAEGGQATAIACNISSKEQIHAMVDQSEAAFGPADVLVCNAAVNPFYGPMSEIPDEAFQKVMAV